MTQEYTVRMHCPAGGEETVTIEADTLNEARYLADEGTRDWLRDGDWGSDGARVEGWWEMLDADGERLVDEDGDDVMGDATVEIEPDHDTLIRKACGGTHSSEWERCCGGDPDDHDWTSEGEGGCDSNPGVWSTGGTSMLFASHCRVCGLSRREHHTGPQRNPGEHDTVEYTMPESWCEECQSEECSCEPETVTCCVCGDVVPVDDDDLECVATDHGPDYVCGGCEYEGD